MGDMQQQIRRDGGLLYDGLTCTGGKNNRLDKVRLVGVILALL